MRERVVQQILCRLATLKDKEVILRNDVMADVHKLVDWLLVIILIDHHMKEYLQSPNVALGLLFRDLGRILHHCTYCHLLGLLLFFLPCQFLLVLIDFYLLWCHS